MKNVQLILLLIYGIVGLVTSEDVDIVIIGAGPSGFAAASRLLENGLTNLVVLEAKDRIGGRVNTVNFADNVVEMGAQWVHGEKGNKVFELAAPHDVLKLENGINSTFVEANGEVLPPEESTPIFGLYFSAGDGNDTAEIAPGTSWGSYFTKRFRENYDKKPFTTKERIEYILDFSRKIDCSASASDDWNEVSAIRSMDYWACEGDQLIPWKKNGYKTLFDILQKKFSGEQLNVMEKVQLGKEVKTVDYTNMDKIVVTLIDGTQYNAKHVIFTPSLGVLKRQHSTIFNPPLPQSKQHAIQGIAFGSVLKFFLEYSQPWWPSDLESYSLLWSNKDQEEFIATHGKDKEWLCDVFQFLAVINQPRVLAGWSFGRAGKFTETLSDEEMMDQVHLLITKVFGKTYKDIPKPAKIIRSKWFTDPHTLGTYSYDSLETEKTNASRLDLAEPVKTSDGKPVVLFAGEATSKHRYSTVDGAVGTGFREADRLVDHYKKN